MPSEPSPKDRRSRLQTTWQSYVLCDPRTRRDAPEPAGLRPEIVTSWRRSLDRVSGELAAAPVDDPDATEAAWHATPLSAAVGRIEEQLRSAAEDGGLVVAVTDPGVRILWTCDGSVMRRRAEAVNFLPGGRWDEASVGTNALDLALRTDSTATVHSAEHYSASVHDWSCWAAPVHDPATGRQLGVLDLSTTWDRAHPMGAAMATAFARLLEQALPSHRTPDGMLELRVLGHAEARLDGVPLLLSRRQLEIVTLLALHPEGLRLDALHAHLYGDRPVSVATLKAEVSHLRTSLDGAIGSRPYRILMPVRCDAVTVLDHLADGRLLDAASAYRGELLAGTDAPGLVEHGSYLAVAVREALLAAPEPEAVLRYAEAVPYDVEVLERAVRTADRSTPAAALLRARLKAARDL